MQQDDIPRWYLWLAALLLAGVSYGYFTGEMTNRGGTTLAPLERYIASVVCAGLSLFALYHATAPNWHK